MFYINSFHHNHNSFVSSVDCSDKTEQCVSKVLQPHVRFALVHLSTHTTELHLLYSGMRDDSFAHSSLMPRDADLYKHNCTELGRVVRICCILCKETLEIPS